MPDAGDGTRPAIVEATAADTWACDIIATLDKPDPTEEDLVKCKDMCSHDGVLLHDNMVYVPQSCRARVLAECHDAPLAGHFGRGKTLDLLRRRYWWPGMPKAVKEYVKSCDVCARSKADRHRPYGPLHPLPIPDRP
jgi:Integrase zinc binding domain